MVIEFRKVAQTPKNFENQLDSVKIEGSFCRISPYLIEINSKLSGSVKVECSRCGETFDTKIDEEMEFLISDGIYKETEANEKNLDKVIVEVDNHLIDFNEIIKSELESFKLDYHICDNCKTEIE
eukprot:Anaeramoba_flamelloidesa568114_162.p5 GENE.a568114_162~~a568114_162.p5  ORF type:complete len:125 (-),score=8.25 a568114_162:3023-3397(-)